MSQLYMYDLRDAAACVVKVSEIDKLRSRKSLKNIIIKTNSHGVLVANILCSLRFTYKCLVRVTTKICEFDFSKL